MSDRVMLAFVVVVMALALVAALCATVALVMGLTGTEVWP